ncbi:MAG: retroviral-like aspartic protease family protein [Gammaproteobacteria bacterium]|nr:retroviral-like aspartic protease family protein [Gammaproteobacteria bacterium]
MMRFLSTSVKTVLLALCLLLTSVVAHAGNRIKVMALFKNMAYLQIDGKKQLLSVGETNSAGVSLLRANSKSALIEYQGVEKEYRIGQQVGAAYAKAAKPKMLLNPDAKGMYWVDGRINGNGVRFLVDTGATYIAMSSTMAKRLHIRRPANTPEVTFSTANGLAKAYMVKLSTVEVGTIKLHNIEAGILEGDSPKEILLGMSFLQKLRIEQEGQLLTLEQLH